MSTSKYKQTCWRCEGRGKLPEDKEQCNHCLGEGEVTFSYPGRPKLSGKDFPDQLDNDVQGRYGKLHHS